MAEPVRDGRPPVVSPGARVLILGSFPSERPLESGEYYANRRNQFWRLLGAVFDFDADAPYAERIAAAGSHGVALWDVVRSCRRVGSPAVRLPSSSGALAVSLTDKLVAWQPGTGRRAVNHTTEPVALTWRHVMRVLRHRR